MRHGDSPAGAAERARPVLAPERSDYSTSEGRQDRACWAAKADGSLHNPGPDVQRSDTRGNLRLVTADHYDDFACGLLEAERDWPLQRLLRAAGGARPRGVTWQADTSSTQGAGPARR